MMKNIFFKNLEIAVMFFLKKIRNVEREEWYKGETQHQTFQSFFD